MILVQNHLLRLSGNKFWCLIFICFVLGACSPKTRTNKSAQKNNGNKEENAAGKSEKKFTEANIALLIPLNLNTALVKSGSKAELEKSAMALDFYQGFKMGIDSAASTGLNFKVKVLDTRDNNTQITSLLNSGLLSGYQLIVGPIFPEGIKFMTNYSIANNVPVVSPLAATNPDEFNNPNLISIVNNIEIHAKKIGDHIVRDNDSKNTVVVLISTKSPADEILAAPLRTYFQKQNQRNQQNAPSKVYNFQEYASVFTMERNIIPGKRYVILLASSDRQFVVATLDKLAKIKGAGTAVELFGHPNWSKQNYNTDILQNLNTKITSSYRIDYKSQAVIAFLKKYRAHNSLEPSEYAFKGFDTGLYFGKLFAEHGASYLKYLTQERYKGLHNSFLFIKDPNLGYINTSLQLLEYKNYALTPVE